MRPDQETIDALVAGITKYNNAKTPEEGFGALNNLIEIGKKELEKDAFKTKKQCLELATRKVVSDKGVEIKVCSKHFDKIFEKGTTFSLVDGYQQCEAME